MTHHSITGYLEAKVRYAEFHARIINGIGEVFVNGSWVSYDEFNYHNSKPNYEPPVLQNPDGKNISSGVKIFNRK